MPTRNVVLTEHQEAFIGELVRSGRYSNASEVLRESLRLMERRESLEAAKLDYLRGRLDEAEQDALAERLVTYEPGLLDRLEDETEGESTGTSYRATNGRNDVLERLRARSAARNAVMQ